MTSGAKKIIRFLMQCEGTHRNDNDWIINMDKEPCEVCGLALCFDCAEIVEERGNLVPKMWCAQCVATGLKVESIPNETPK